MDDDFKKTINKLFESNRSLIMEYFEDEVKTKYISRSSAHKILFYKANITSGVVDGSLSMDMSMYHGESLIG